MSLLAGGMGVAPRVKQAFEHARRDADRRQRATIDPAGLLLGMVEVEDAVSNELLRDAGVDPSEVRRVLLDPVEPAFFNETFHDLFPTTHCTKFERRWSPKPPRPAPPSFPRR
jgi:hypothetical protein